VEKGVLALLNWGPTRGSGQWYLLVHIELAEDLSGVQQVRVINDSVLRP